MKFADLWAALTVLGPGGLFWITVLDTALLPTAQAVDLLILTRAARSPEDAWLLGLTAVVGSTCGGMALYWGARSGGRWALRKGFSEERLAAARAEFARHDAAALVIPTMIPIPLAPMKLFIFAAGALEVDPLRAASAIAVARFARYFGLIFLGVRFGEDAGRWVERHSAAAAAGAVAGFALYLWARRRAARGEGS